jgi:hypothetical protein
MLDLGQLLPTAKRDAKLDTKSDRAVINEAAELKVALFTRACSAFTMARCGAERAYGLLLCQARQMCQLWHVLTAVQQACQVLLCQELWGMPFWLLAPAE